MSRPLMKVANLVQTFGGEKRLFGLMAPHPAVQAVRGVGFELAPGETLGVVGESGCGKSTLARMLCGLDVPTGGSIELDGEDITHLARHDIRSLAKKIQYVFQDPVGALNPRKTIREILQIPMKRLLGYDREKCRRRTEELMQAVNLRQEFLDRYPHEFSGGQAQRIGVARALAAEARILILDEPVSALDVSVQAQVLNLFDELKTRFNLTYVFISHDLSVVESVSDRVAVMYLGRIVEIAPAAQLFRSARHPYTRLLLDSAPVPGKLSTPVSDQSSELPDPLNPPPGCAFAPRCRYARENCRRDVPGLHPQSGSEHRVSCFYPLA